MHISFRNVFFNKKNKMVKQSYVYSFSNRFPLRNRLEPLQISKALNAHVGLFFDECLLRRAEETKPNSRKHTEKPREREEESRDFGRIRAGFEAFFRVIDVPRSSSVSYTSFVSILTA